MESFWNSLKIYKSKIRQRRSSASPPAPRVHRVNVSMKVPILFLPGPIPKGTLLCRQQGFEKNSIFSPNWSSESTIYCYTRKLTLIPQLSSFYKLMHERKISMKAQAFILIKNCYTTNYPMKAHVSTFIKIPTL